MLDFKFECDIMILCHSGVAKLRHARKGGLGVTYIDAVVLGLILGICETLPVSGSGHLAMLRSFFGSGWGSWPR